MNALRIGFFLPSFLHVVLGSYETFQDLCPSKHGNSISLNAGFYTVSCGGYFDGSFTRTRVDLLGIASPEDCARLCSGNMDCDAMVFDGDVCWEYSARGETIAPLLDPEGNTVLLLPVIKTNPNDFNDRTPQPPPPVNPAQLQQQLDQCIQDKYKLQTSLQTLEDKCEQNNQALANEWEACRLEGQRATSQRDACVILRDQYKQERDQCRNPPTPLPVPWSQQAASLQCKRDDHTVVNTGTKRFKLRCQSYKPTGSPGIRYLQAKFSYADCMDACRADSSCHGFQWAPGGKDCTLFPFIRDHELVFNGIASPAWWAGVTA